MSVSRDRENFQIWCDCNRGRARIAMIGSDGSEVLIALHFEGGDLEMTPAVREAILKEGEVRLRKALLALIAKGWPEE